MANIIKGRNLRIFLNGIAIGCATDCNLDYDHDPVEIIPEEDWRYKEYIEGNRKWSLSASALMAVDDNDGNIDLISLIEAKSPFLARFSTAAAHSSARSGNNGIVPTGTRSRWGMVFCTSISEKGSKNGKATYSIKLKGHGPLFHSSSSVVPQVISGSIMQIIIDSGTVMQSILKPGYVICNGKLYIYNAALTSNIMYYSVWPKSGNGKYESSDDMNSSSYIFVSDDGTVYEWGGESWNKKY